MFAPSGDKVALETGDRLTPRFDERGLIQAVAVDMATREVLMVATMNAEALALTIETGVAHYWSRSRQALWRKGATSGHSQKVVELRIDCDQDAVVLLVEAQGPGQCHVGHRSCFYRSVELKRPAADARLTTDRDPSYQASQVYG